MTKIVEFLKKLRADERGVSAVEYAILAGVLLVIIVSGVNVLGTAITGLFASAASALP